MALKVEGVLESSLYVDDLDRAVQFYQTLFEFELMARWDDRGIALKVKEGQVLLLFKKGASPDHDGSGNLHLAFAVTNSELDRCERVLNGRGIVIESRRSWELGGRSIYFRDPDGHLLELATTGTWPNY